VRKAILVYNPKGGNKKAQRLLDTLVSPLLREADFQVEIVATTHRGHAEEIGRTAELDKVDALVVMGGDGTLGEVATGILSRTDGVTCPLGFVPAGTGNTVTRELLGCKTAGACESGVRAAIGAITGGRTRQIDALKLALVSEKDAKTPITRYALNTVMAGFGPDANAAAERRRWLGPSRYTISILTEILKVPFRKPLPCTLTVDGEARSMDDLFLFACQNNKFTGVAHRIAPRAQLDDGKVDLLYTNTPLRSIGLAMKLDGRIKAGGSHIHHKIVTYEQTTVVKLEATKPTRLMIDGDLCGVTPLTVETVPAALTVFTPNEPHPS